MHAIMDCVSDCIVAYDIFQMYHKTGSTHSLLIILVLSYGIIFERYVSYSIAVQIYRKYNKDKNYNKYKNIPFKIYLKIILYTLIFAENIFYY